MTICIWHGEKWTDGNDVRVRPEWAVESKYVVIQESAAFLSSNRKNAQARRIVSVLANRASRFLELYALNLLGMRSPHLRLRVCPGVVPGPGCFIIARKPGVR